MLVVVLDVATDVGTVDVLDAGLTASVTVGGEAVGGPSAQPGRRRLNSQAIPAARRAARQLKPTYAPSIWRRHLSRASDCNDVHSDSEVAGDAGELGGIARDHRHRTEGPLSNRTEMGVGDGEVEGVPDGCGAVRRRAVQRRVIRSQPVDGDGGTGRPPVPARFDADGGWRDEAN